MPVDQDWSNVWPGPRTFHPAVVPLPLRQGYDQRRVAPGKFANAELMKIPNFLHLTPPAIQKHCDAIQKFCTPWPTGLETEIQMEKHFPLTVITSDYCHSSPTVRDTKARIVTIKVRTCSVYLIRPWRCSLHFSSFFFNAKTRIFSFSSLEGCKTFPTISVSNSRVPFQIGRKRKPT